jgi:hypothetical protein
MTSGRHTGWIDGVIRWAFTGSVDHGANASGGSRFSPLYRKDEAAGLERLSW